uniref:NADH dehydrogenase [ubiquinone] 1 alpha subcomplex subunit 7 n=1 Tax=Cyprinus carpio carpio TaxID=630221 RepID=A0A8C1E838_CYPCA
DLEHVILLAFRRQVQFSSYRVVLGQQQYNQDLQSKLQLRYTEISKRTQPPPNLPVGPSHKCADNYYCQRDGRRESVPPTVVMSSRKALTAGSEASGKPKRPVIPGTPPKELPLSVD